MSTTELQGATALTFNNGELIPTTAFLQFVELAKAVEEAWKQVYTTMDEHGIKKFPFATGYVTTSERKNWKITPDIDARYTKVTADTKELNKAYDSGVLPTGSDFTTTVFKVKRLK